MAFDFDFDFDGADTLMIMLRFYVCASCLEINQFQVKDNEEV